MISKQMWRRYTSGKISRTKVGCLNVKISWSNNSCKIWPKGAYKSATAKVFYSVDPWRLAEARIRFSSYRRPMINRIVLRKVAWHLPVKLPTREDDSMPHLRSSSAKSPVKYLSFKIYLIKKILQPNFLKVKIFQILATI